MFCVCLLLIVLVDKCCLAWSTEKKLFDTPEICISARCVPRTSDGTALFNLVTCKHVRHIFKHTSRVPVEGKSPVCVICMKYRITILIIIIISLGQTVLSYIATHTHSRTHTHTQTHTRAHTHKPPWPFRLLLFVGTLAPNRDAVNAPFLLVAGDQWPVAGSFK